MRQRVIDLFSVALVCASAFARPAPTASVTGGKISGRGLNGGAVFLGVPFAAPPEGQLRWKPPLPVKAWTGVHEAGEYAATCAPGGRGLEQDCDGCG